MNAIVLTYNSDLQSNTVYLVNIQGFTTQVPDGFGPVSDSVSVRTMKDRMYHERQFSMLYLILHNIMNDESVPNKMLWHQSVVIIIITCHLYSAAKCKKRHTALGRGRSISRLELNDGLCTTKWIFWKVVNIVFNIRSSNFGTAVFEVVVMHRL